MEFYITTEPEPVAQHLASTISSRLEAGETVLWLVPGGSSIAVAVRCSELLRGANLHSLNAMLTDERYGPPDHPDSNLRQLIEAGFSLPGATIVNVLVGKDHEATTRSYAENLSEQLQAADFRIGLFGIGSDGHTAGIKPGSKAVDSNNLAEFFVGEDFQRITMTPLAIAKLDEAVVFATGSEKHRVLDGLVQEIEPRIQPAQVLKKVPSLLIFNDYKGKEYGAED